MYIFVSNITFYADTSKFELATLTFCALY